MSELIVVPTALVPWLALLANGADAVGTGNAHPLGHLVLHFVSLFIVEPATSASSRVRLAAATPPWGALDTL